MATKDKDYFIEFANYTAESIERIYEEFPKDLLSKPEDLPALDATIETNLHSLLVVCIGPNMCPIPDRMIAFAKSFQQSLRNILDNIIVTGGRVNESDGLNFIITLQERTITKYEIADGRLIENTMPSPDDKGKVMITPGWLKFSCRTFIDFLCHKNLKQLKKCPHCKKYFIAKDIKRKICYEKNCQNMYHKEDMKKRRDRDPVRYC